MSRAMRVLCIAIVLYGGLFVRHAKAWTCDDYTCTQERCDQVCALSGPCGGEIVACNWTVCPIDDVTPVYAPVCHCFSPYEC